MDGKMLYLIVWCDSKELRCFEDDCRWPWLLVSRRFRPTRSILRATAQAHLLQSSLGYAPRPPRRTSANQHRVEQFNSRRLDFEQQRDAQY